MISFQEQLPLDACLGQKCNLQVTHASMVRQTAGYFFHYSLFLSKYIKDEKREVSVFHEINV